MVSAMPSNWAKEYTMLKLFRIFVSALATVWLAGCAVTPEQCDPRNADAGFATKFGCSTQGVYAQRVEAKEQVLLDEQKTNLMFREVQAALEQERSAVSQKLANQQNQHDALNRSLKPLLDEIRSKAGGNQRIQAEIAAVERELGNVNQQGNRTELQKRQEIRRLQNAVNKLQTELDAI
jgi:septal ring factor EnvC (AmiA/AmiB activator)